ncbi:MAG: hypothetical protein U5N58_12540 [Actinomycetota bacterium]|nr:hypothetical protein [Actinomycetota bacterium]
MRLSALQLASSLSIGDSVAVDGCCLTVEKKGKEGFEAYISYQTMEHTTFARVQQGRVVNLEPALARRQQDGRSYGNRTYRLGGQNTVHRKEGAGLQD